MQTSVKKLSQSQVELKIEVPAEELQGFYEKAVLEAGKKIQADGFRKGNAPKEIVEEKAGRQNILADAAENCVRESYLKAVKENNIEPIGQPKIEILKMALGNPLEFRAAISVMPQVKLPDYKKIASAIERKSAEVTKEEIAKLKTEKEKMEKEKLRQEILEKIGEETEAEIPPVLIEAEQGRILENIKHQVVHMLNISFDDYLRKINKTEQEMLESLRPEAEKKVRNSLVLKEIQKQENILAAEEEIQAESGKILQNYPEASQVDRERLKEYTKEVIRNEKTLSLLENYARKQ